MWLINRSAVFWAFGFLVIVTVVFGISTNGIFLRFANFQSMATNASILIIIAVGMTFLLAAAELDRNQSGGGGG